jgi:negative regulator of flagellin synthesis FlgM
MKIDSSTKIAGSVQSSAGTRAAEARPAAINVTSAASSAGQAATVVAAALHSVSGSEAAINLEKVEEIRQAIGEGRFKINAEKIADGLINSVREMLDQNRRSSS